MEGDGLKIPDTFRRVVGAVRGSAQENFMRGQEYVENWREQSLPDLDRMGKPVWLHGEN